MLQTGPESNHRLFSTAYWAESSDKDQELVQAAAKGGQKVVAESVFVTKETQAVAKTRKLALEAAVARVRASRRLCLPEFDIGMVYHETPLLINVEPSPNGLALRRIILYRPDRINSGMFRYLMSEAVPEASKIIADIDIGYPPFPLYPFRP